VEGQRKSGDDEARGTERDWQNANFARRGSRSMTRDGSLRRLRRNWWPPSDGRVGLGDLDAMFGVGMCMRCSIWEREGKTVSGCGWRKMADLHFGTIVSHCCLLELELMYLSVAGRRIPFSEYAGLKLGLQNALLLLPRFSPRCLSELTRILGDTTNVDSLRLSIGL
jgi:hypothetical protein